MAVPKKRTTSSSRDQRRMHIFLKKPALAKCSKCGHFALPHAVCPNCGYYKGNEVVNVLKKLDKKERKIKEKELAGEEAKGGNPPSEEKQTEEGKEKPLNWENLSKK